MESHENKGNHGGGVFAWGGKACGKAQMSTQRPLCQRKTHEGLENGLANLWSRQKISKITKKAYAGRGHDSKWEIPDEDNQRQDSSEALARSAKARIRVSSIYRLKRRTLYPLLCSFCDRF